MKSRTTQRLAIAAAAALGFSSTAFSAATVWSGTDDQSNFQDPANWVGGVAPASGATVQFDQTGLYNSASAAAIDLSLGAGGAPGTASFSLGEITVGLSTTGATTPTLTFNNSQGGTLTLTGSTGLLVNTKQTNPVTFATNIALGYTGTQIFNINAATTISGLLSGASTTLLEKTGSGALTLSNGGNSFSGGFVAGQNYTYVGATGALGAGNVQLGYSGLGATGTAGLETSVAGVSVANNITVYNSVAGSSTILGGNQIGSSSFLGTITLNNTNGTTNLESAAGGGAVTFSGQITGAGGITKLIAGSVTLGNGTSNYTGGTTVKAGTLIVAANPVVTGGVLTSSPIGTGLLTISSATLSDDGNARVIYNPVYLNSAATFGGTGGLTIDGTGAGQLTTPNAVTLTANSTLTTNVATTIDSVITDNGGNFSITKAGTKALVLAGANTYSGGVKVTAGTLTVANTSSISGGVITNGPLGTGTVTLSGGTLGDDGTARTIYNAVAIGGSVTLGGTKSLTIDGTGGGQLTTPNALTLTSNTTVSTSDPVTIKSVIGDAGSGFNLIKTGGQPLTLSGLNTYSGATTIQQNAIQVAANVPAGAPGALGNATSPVQVGSASTGTASNALLETDGAFTIGRDISVWNLAGNPGYTSGAVTLGGMTNSKSQFTGQITLNGAASFTSVATGANTVDFSGNITGPGAINKVGAGAVQIDNATNNYSGGTNLSAGTLLVTNSSVVTGGALASGPLGTGTLTLTGGTLSDDGSPQTIANGVSIGGTVGFASTGSGSITIDGTSLISPTGVLLSSSSTLNVVNTTVFNSSVSDGGNAYALTKGGAGVLVLNGVNTYTGGTNVNLGTLVINGTIPGGGAFVVNSGGTLGGTGAITTGSAASGLTVAAGAIIAPGLTSSGPAVSGATLQANGDVTINGTLSIQADANTSQLDTTGALTLGPSSTLLFTGNSSLTALDYVIATYGPSGLSGQFGTISNEPSGYSIDYNYANNNDIALVASGVPEPASLGLFGLAIVGLLAGRRRRRHRLHGL